MQLTANPLKMIEQLIGPELRDKIYKNLSLIICVALLIFMAPVLATDIFVAIVKGIFGFN